MPDALPRLEPQAASDGAGAVVRVLGPWTASHLAEDRLLRELQAGLDAAKRASWDLSAAQLDHVGAQLLWDHWGRRWPDKVEALPGQRAVLERVAKYTVQPPRRRRKSLVDHYLDFGGALLRATDHFKEFTRMLGMLAINVGQLASAPHRGPWRDFSGNLFRIGATALPITALVGTLIGVVLAYLTAVQLRQFGANAFIVNIMGVGLIRELGPLLAAILIAGRSGSAITAQIGAMRVTDELDAMSVMGISHSYRLVMPRALALAVAMPLISVWTTLCGLAGGIIASDLSLGITPSFFIHALPEAVGVGNLVLNVAKSVVFGVLIAMVGCHFGLRVQPNTQSLGEGTTASVVTAITIVILVDALFAILFKDTGF